ncbi:hypothetical protein TrCOL_g11262 [Triparma columacea]|uniref:Trimethylguanosine synthase n=1 Tax=Triparma columacea TaxID=722753 RepID=A0A9W7G765_9STRA|nr:hypothetical protein TrCOL_g11262 [Triparma columacea]
MTLETAPGNLKYKWSFLWKNLDDNAQGKIMMDEVATFSVTESRLADRMSGELLSLPGVTYFSKIVDATACVGGNTISFAKAFKEVVGIEMSEERATMLSNNIDLVRAEMKRKDKHFAGVKVIIGDSLRVVPTIIDADVIFFDPPWGGVDYKNQTLCKLSLSGVPMSKFVLDASANCSYVALKLPMNANLDKITNVPSILRVVKRVEMCKMQFIVLQGVRKGK